MKFALALLLVHAPLTLSSSSWTPTNAYQSGYYENNQVYQQQQELPPGWTEHFDQSSGQPYYYNAEQGITTWDRPENLSNSTDTAMVEEPALDGSDNNNAGSSAESNSYNVTANDYSPDTWVTQNRNQEQVPQKQWQSEPNLAYSNEDAQENSNEWKSANYEQENMTEATPDEPMRTDNSDSQYQQPPVSSADPRQYQQPIDPRQMPSQQELPKDPRQQHMSNDQQHTPDSPRQQPQSTDPRQQHQPGSSDFDLRQQQPQIHGDPRQHDPRQQQQPSPTNSDYDPRQQRPPPNQYAQQQQQQQQPQQRPSSMFNKTPPQQQGVPPQYQQGPGTQQQEITPQYQQGPNAQQQPPQYQQGPGAQQQRPIQQQQQQRPDQPQQQPRPEPQQQRPDQQQQQQQQRPDQGPPQVGSGMPFQQRGPPFGVPQGYGRSVGPPSPPLARYNQYNPYPNQQYGRPPSQSGALVQYNTQQTSPVRESLGKAWQGIMGFGNRTKEVVESAKNQVVNTAEQATQQISTTGSSWWGQAKDSFGSFFEASTNPYSLSGAFGPAPSTEQYGYSQQQQQGYVPQQQQQQQRYPYQQQPPMQGGYPPQQGMSPQQQQQQGMLPQQQQQQGIPPPQQQQGMPPQQQGMLPQQQQGMPPQQQQGMPPQQQGMPPQQYSRYGPPGRGGPPPGYRPADPNNRQANYNPYPQPYRGGGEKDNIDPWQHPGLGGDGY